MDLRRAPQRGARVWKCAAARRRGVHGAPTALSDARAHPKPHATASRHHAADVASARLLELYAARWKSRSYRSPPRQTPSSPAPSKWTPFCAPLSALDAKEKKRPLWPARS